jgi:hypothetical protein
VAATYDDQDFVYKKSGDYVVLLFKLALPQDFRLEDLTEFYLGFNMVTSSCRLINLEPFTMKTPVMINVGAIKGEPPAKPTQSTAQKVSSQVAAKVAAPGHVKQPSMT